MKIAIYGATGQVGRRIVTEATSRGHEVTALSRHRPELGLPDGAQWRHGDVTDPTAVADIAATHDAVVAAHGPSREPGGDPSAFTGQFAAFAAAVGSTRLLVIGGAGSLLAAPGIRLVDTPEFPQSYKGEALAHAAVLADLRAGSSSTWTYVSPAPVLEAGERTGAFEIGDDTPVGTWVSYEDLAVAVVDELENPAHAGSRFTLASR